MIFSIPKDKQQFDDAGDVGGGAQVQHGGRHRHHPAATQREVLLQAGQPHPLTALPTPPPPLPLLTQVSSQPHPIPAYPPPPPPLPLLTQVSSQPHPLTALPPLPLLPHHHGEERVLPG